jgi:hypothetical protein
MLGEAAGFLTSPCLPNEFSSYGGWTGATTLFGMLIANASQLLLTNTQSTQSDTLLKKLNISSNSQAKTSVYVLEVGVAVHSILIGLTLGILSGDVNYL